MEKQDKKKNKGLIVLIIILILIILGLTAYILYDKNIIFNNAKETVEKEKNTTTTDNKSESKDAEIEINNEAVKKELSKKIDYLTSSNYDSKGEDYSLTNSYGFAYTLLDNKTLTDDEKLLATLSVLNSNLTTSTQITIDINQMKLPSEYESMRTTIKETSSQIKESDVNSLYKSLFGGNAANKTVKKSHSCPVFIYDSTNQVYYTVAACGGTSGSAVLSYKGAYTKKKNEAYVDVYYGLVQYTTTDTYNLYTKINITDTDQPFQTNIDINQTQITKENSNNFEKYRYTFKLNNNEYNFVKVEKIK